MTLHALFLRANSIRARYAAAAEASEGTPWGREQFLQGFVVDVGQLMRLVMAKAGVRAEENLDERLGHELADCLWSVLILSDVYEVDLEGAFWTSMAEIEAGVAARVGAAAPSPAPTPVKGTGTLGQMRSRALEVRHPFAAFEGTRAGKERTIRQLMQGLVVDVGELARRVMAKADLRQVPNLDQALAHALADCLWSVLVLSDALEVHLEGQFLTTMDAIEAKLAKEGARPERNGAL